jgi:hypothetical protein
MLFEAGCLSQIIFHKLEEVNQYRFWPQQQAWHEAIKPPQSPSWFLRPGSMPLFAWSAPTLWTWYPTSPLLFYKPKLFSQRLQLQGARRRVRTGAEIGSRVKPTGDTGIFDRIITTERWSCTIMIETLNRPPRSKPRQHVESSSPSQKGKQAAWIEGPWGC